MNITLCPVCHAKFTKRPRCPECGNAWNNHPTDAGWWRCGECQAVFIPKKYSPHKDMLTIVTKDGQELQAVRL